MKIVLSALGLSAALAASTAFAQASVSEAGRAAMEKACVACHDTSMSASFVTADGSFNEENVKFYAAKIVERVQSTTRPMPPKSAPAFMQPTAAEKTAIVAYAQSLQVPATPTTPEVDSDAIVPLSKLAVEPGFKIEVFAQARGARSLAVHSSGIVFVGTGGFSDVDPNGRVHAIVPTTSGNKTVTLASGLDNPNGVALVGNDLYVAQRTRIVLYRDAVSTATAIAAGRTVRVTPVVIKNDLRNQSNHSWKYLAYGPDNRLYYSVGADCNVCNEDREEGAAIFSMNLDGSDVQQVAKGVRNSVGFSFHPDTGAMWFTDNGRDSLGDGLPPDELNVLTSPVQDYGFPYCFGKTVKDPQYGGSRTCNEAQFTKPVVDLGAHVAALGLTHYAGEAFPAKYDRAIFIAEHGSWNSSKKVGYRLSIVEQTGSSYTYRPFISGWVDAAGRANWGRPVDVKNYIDGSLLLSDDNAGIVYRISYAK